MMNRRDFLKTAAASAPLLISASGGQTLAWLAVAGFPLTLFLQRWVSGT